MSESFPIQFDFNQVPDTIKPVAPGVYTLLVSEIKVNDPKDTAKHGKLKVCEFTLTIQDQGADVGRQMRHWENLWLDNTGRTQEQIARSLTGFKRLALSAGLQPANGFDLMSIRGKLIRGRVESAIFEKDGRKIESSEIRDFLIPSDPGFQPV